MFQLIVDQTVVSSDVLSGCK